MITLLYLILIVIFLVLLKDLFFSNSNISESFHPFPQSEPTTIASEDPTQVTESPESVISRAVAQAQAQAQAQNQQSSPGSAPTTLATGSSPGSPAPSPAGSSPAPSPAGSPPAHYPSSPTTSSANQPGSTNPSSVLNSQQARRAAQSRIDQENEEVTEVTTPSDELCCGVEIYDRTLGNINKCILQHIENSGDRLNPRYVDWKEVDEELNECRSPQPILARTSNCHDIVKKYEANINSLLCLVNDSNRRCTYNHNFDDVLDGGLSDADRYSIFIGNISCLDDNGNEVQGESRPYGNGDSGYNVRRCE